MVGIAELARIATPVTTAVKGAIDICAALTLFEEFPAFIAIAVPAVKTCPLSPVFNNPAPTVAVSYTYPLPLRKFELSQMALTTNAPAAIVVTVEVVCVSEVFVECASG